MKPIFDLLLDDFKCPDGLSIAEGYDLSGNYYYGLVEVDNKGIIGTVITFVCVPFRFSFTDRPHANFEANFLTRLQTNLKQAI